jgi:hypothetical protein
MLYACICCNKLTEQSLIEEYTHKIIPEYFIPIGSLGWLGSTYICPLCNEENAGYDLRTEDYFFKRYLVQWKDGGNDTFEGVDIVDALKRIDSVDKVSNIKIYKEVS